MSGSKPAYTPGPWRVDPRHCCDVETLSGVQITAALSEAEVGEEWQIIGPCPSLDEAEANARLIAAAPDLLEALKRTLEYAEDHQAAQPNDETFADLALIRAAIAKATGSGRPA